eukprot:TRINITY_DN43082_c0_g1_i1.p1 TRINITY_DN43082_c0_g1~~TRINITY_DN43082_c0_g1_i1.p1  ORF type:complete len:242 (+),score=83.43 TRINITY_DN43082_c0_g1_i1:64-726(+)
MTSSLHIVVIGDSATGKSTLLKRYQGIRPGDDYSPRCDSLNVYRGQEFVMGEAGAGGSIQSLLLMDTAGQDTVENFGKLTYSNANCFVVCYSVDSNESFRNAEFKWVPEIRNADGLKNVPIVLCATKTDLRGDADLATRMREEGRPLLSAQEGERLAERLPGVTYCECSANAPGEDDPDADGGVKAVITTAARLAYEHACKLMKEDRKIQKKTAGCCVLS